MTAVSTEDDLPRIPEYFTGKSIFITGASGFMGKVLIEKLLRSCPQLNHIYILVRTKRGKTPDERVKAITNLQLFDLLREEQPENFKKIIPVLGDVTELNLGLSDFDRQRIIDEVHIIYHAAASVRFDDSLYDATIMNTRGTREIVNLAKEMKHLEVLAHLSTTYCNTDRKVIGEKIYPAHADWRETIELAEKLDSHTLDILTPKYIHPLPNTYTFTKGLAEHVINDLCDGEIPALIMRPSIVISTKEEPVAGWVDNFNGPVGILVACGKGILRSMYTNPDITADYVPVDIIIKSLIIATWRKGVERNKEEKLKVSVYNASNNKINNITFGELVNMGKQLCWDYPLNNVIWYPNGSVTRSYYYHYFRLILYHLVPALIIDGLLKLAGKKTILLKVQRKIYIANMALQYFIGEEWEFINDKASALERNILDSDKKAFSFDRNEPPYEFFRKGLLGARQYLLREDMSTFENAKTHSRRMYYVDKVVKKLWLALFMYLLFVKFNIINVAKQYVITMFEDA